MGSFLTVAVASSRVAPSDKPPDSNGTVVDCGAVVPSEPGAAGAAGRLADLHGQRPAFLLVQTIHRPYPLEPQRFK
jgi:hypothetical protein